MMRMADLVRARVRFGSVIFAGLLLAGLTVPSQAQTAGVNVPGLEGASGWRRQALEDAVRRVGHPVAFGPIHEVRNGGSAAFLALAGAAGIPALNQHAELAIAMLSSVRMTNGAALLVRRGDKTKGCVVLTSDETMTYTAVAFGMVGLRPIEERAVRLSLRPPDPPVRGRSPHRRRRLRRRHRGRR